MLKEEIIQLIGEFLDESCKWPDFIRFLEARSIDPIDFGYNE